jgi:hypothetical protein
VTDLTPGPSVLLSYQVANLKWPTILGELIDNAYDAGASSVTVKLGPGKVCSVSDNGKGCGDMAAMLTLGKHHAHTTTRLGRYGVGLKAAACWLWGKCDINTYHANKQYGFRVDWAKLARQDIWEVPDAIVTPCDKDDEGTVIKFSNIIRALPSSYDRLVDELSYQFTPGLLSGRQLVFKFPRKAQIVARPYKSPPLENIVEDEFLVGDRGVRLRVGIVKEGHDNPKPGWTICHYHRVIKHSSQIAGTYSTRRIAGQVFLDDAWTLNVHKDGVSEGDEELTEAIHERCKDILEIADKQAQSISSEVFTTRLNEKLRIAMGELKKTKAMRVPPENSTGTVKPKGTGRKHKKAKHRQPGDKMLSDKQIGKLRIDWKPCDDNTLGCIDSDASLIWLNEGNKYLRHMRKTENDSALLGTAIGMYVNEAVHSNGMQKMLPGFLNNEGMSFPSVWAQILDTIADLPQN